MNLRQTALLSIMLCLAILNIKLDARGGGGHGGGGHGGGHGGGGHYHGGGRGYYHGGGRGYWGGGWGGGWGGWGGWGYPYGGFGIGYNYGPYGGWGWGGPYWGGGYWGGPVVAPTVVIPIGGGDNSPRYVQPKSTYLPYQDRQGSQEWMVTNTTDMPITFRSNHESSQTIINPGESKTVSHRQSFLFKFSAPGKKIEEGQTEDHHITISQGIFGNLTYTTDNK